MKLFGLLKVGVLVMRESEFKHWYRSARARGKWPSQRSKLQANKRGGRPSKKTQSLQNTILDFVRDATWTAKDGPTKLRRLLIVGGHVAVPSRDTLRRLINDMHAATGQQELLLKKRFRRKASKKSQQAEEALVRAHPGDIESGFSNGWQ